MNILLTGSGGMVGRNILDNSSAKNYKILSPKRSELDLLDINSIENFFKLNKIDIIIHAAGVVGGIQENISNPLRFLVENLQMGVNLINVSKKNNIQNFINLGSSCMYPKNARNPLSENLILQGSLEPTNEAYALAKITITRLCEYISKQHKPMKYITIIPCNIYGKYDDFDLNTSHMIPAAIHKIHDAKKKGKGSVTIWGDGEARREFMYAEDLANFIYFSVKNFKEMPQNINVGLGRDYTINEYYKNIASIIGYKGKFTHDKSKPIGMKQKLIDNKRQKFLGWNHSFDLNEGVTRTYDYFLGEVYND